MYSLTKTVLVQLKIARCYVIKPCQWYKVYIGTNPCASASRFEVNTSTRDSKLLRIHHQVVVM